MDDNFLKAMCEEMQNTIQDQFSEIHRAEKASGIYLDNYKAVNIFDKIYFERLPKDRYYVPEYINGKFYFRMSLIKQPPLAYVKRGETGLEIVKMEPSDFTHAAYAFVLSLFAEYPWALLFV